MQFLDLSQVGVIPFSHILLDICIIGTWNVRSLYRAGALGLVTSELGKYRMDLVGVQEVGWEGSIIESENKTYVKGKIMPIIN